MFWTVTLLSLPLAAHICPFSSSMQMEQLRAELMQERTSRQDLECDKISLERQVGALYLPAVDIHFVELKQQHSPPPAGGSSATEMFRIHHGRDHCIRMRISFLLYDVYVRDLVSMQPAGGHVSSRL